MFPLFLAHSSYVGHTIVGCAVLTTCAKPYILVSGLSCLILPPPPDAPRLAVLHAARYATLPGAVHPPLAVCCPQGFGETFPTNPKVAADMTALHHIHEAGILYNLGERSKLRNQRPYTFMVRQAALAATDV